jgi:hypothetical protein
LLRPSWFAVSFVLMLVALVGSCSGSSPSDSAALAACEQLRRLARDLDGPVDAEHLRQEAGDIGGRAAQSALRGVRVAGERLRAAVVAGRDVFADLDALNVACREVGR